MGLISIKTTSLWKQLRNTWSFLRFRKKPAVDQEDLDKRLIYDLSSRKIPSPRQIKHLNKFLNPREFLIVKICLLVVIINAAYLVFVLISKHIQYSPLPGGVYSEGVVAYPKNINPLYAVNRDVDSDISRLVYSSLFQYDNLGRLVNDLAGSVSISANNLDYSVKIKKNVKWHNGSKLTIEDVLFTFDLIKNPDFRSPLRLALTKVEAIKVDDSTIKFSLSEPYAPFLELLTFGIMPKSLWENTSPGAAVLSDLNLKPVGSGPFKFKSLVKNTSGDLKEYYLEASKDYYGRVPYISGINFKFFTDYPEAIKALNDNKIMGLNYLPFDFRKDLLAKDSLFFHELIQPRIVSLFFNNTKNKALADKEIRVALAKAINKDQIINDVFNNTYQVADGPILKQNFAYNDALTVYGYSALEAAAIISKKPLAAILTVVDTGSNMLVAEEIKDFWEKIGVKISLQVISAEEAANIIKDRNFEILLYGEFVGGDPDVYAFWHSSQIGSRGLNLANYNNPAVDKLLSEARALTDLDSRISRYKKFQEIITNDLPVIFLYSPAYPYIQSSKLQGFSGTMIVNPADRFSGVSDWYLKTKKKIIW
ncbi:MAG: peptide ABC transporter substrate-binding protein [Patescibacteria group bacterium]